MSWFSITLIIVVASFACAYGLCEWILLRRRNAQERDRDSFV